jgi:uncharacterized protein YbgA (DUF1722 family)
MSGASSGLHAGGAEAGSPGILGHFTDRLEPIARRELLGVVEDYRRGLIPLIAPLILVRQYVRTLKAEYLLGQTYLDPHPTKLMLRNRV